MASSLISSSLHVDFDSVFGMDDAGLVQMFESFIVTGLKDFLGCPAVFYEAALTEFFKNSSVRDGVVVSTIRGTTIEISEEMFTAAFDLPTEGLTNLSEVPKNLVLDARSIFSDSKKKVSISCLKKEMKLQYRLLSDILAKTLYIKAGSFDAVTRDQFILMTAITCDVKINWSNLLFGILKDMSTGCVLGKWVYLVTLVMSLFNLQDVCIVIGSLATLDLPMVVDLIGIYVLKGPYCTLTMTDWFLQVLSMIPRGSWGDVSRHFTMIRWASPKL
ncbi:hypothetical protein F511_36199 [Dorcoceras hygrometricum]|uniref:Dystroglycan-like n=1 Tax=Dorcoceras hygrometricum TaxID=472368 RepID=A0A2Z7BM50_9LAMI|nr:hypothetical protein F511_36199 [Dorcoceras hygrometricum]